jgi:hypothetical protein
MPELTPEPDSTGGEKLCIGKYAQFK